MMYNQRFASRVIIERLLRPVQHISENKEAHIFGCRYIAEDDTIIISYKMLNKEIK